VIRDQAHAFARQDREVGGFQSVDAEFDGASGSDEDYENEKEDETERHEG